MNEKQLAKLIKKTTAKAAAKSTRARPARSYDPTLQTRTEEDAASDERAKMFDEMKRREF
jgi:hypothetical protein